MQLSLPKNDSSNYYYYFEYDCHMYICLSLKLCLEAKVAAFLHAEYFDMQQYCCFKAEDDWQGDDGGGVHRHVEHFVLGKECFVWADGQGLRNILSAIS